MEPERIISHQTAWNIKMHRDDFQLISTPQVVSAKVFSKFYHNLISQGTYGTVHSTCPPSEKACPYVMKVISFEKDSDRIEIFKNEAHISSAMGKHSVGPRVHKTYQSKVDDDPSKKFGVIMMDRLDLSFKKFIRDIYPTLSPTLQEQFIDVLWQKIQRMHSQGIWHNDLLSRNIMIKEVQPNVYEPFIIDFGASYKWRKGSLPLILRLADGLSLIFGHPDLEDIKNWSHPPVEYHCGLSHLDIPTLAQQFMDKMESALIQQFGKEEYFKVYPQAFRSRIDILGHQPFQRSGIYEFEVLSALIQKDGASQAILYQVNMWGASWFRLSQTPEAFRIAFKS